jgi:MFS family permease
MNSLRSIAMARPARLRGAAAMWAVAGELGAMYVLSNLPTPLYVVYRQVFGFSQLTLTFAYAVYVVGTIATMFFLGRLSDQIGRRPVVLASICLGALSEIVFLVAASTAWLIVARILTGFAIALAAGASTAWIVELHPRQDKAAATRIALAANCLGLAVGPLLAGIIAQNTAAPLRVPYVPFIPLLLIAAAMTWSAQETIDEPTPFAQASMRPRIGVPREIRGSFVTPAIAAFATFAVLGYYSALTPSLLKQALHVSNLAVGGTIVAALFLVAMATIITAPRMEPRTGMIAGLILLLPTIALLVLSEASDSMALLLAGTATGGVSGGLGYAFGLERVNEVAPEERRSEVISSYLIVCYAAISLPVIGVGVLSQITSSMIADAVFGALIALLTIAALVFELGPARRRAAR